MLFVHALDPADHQIKIGTGVIAGVVVLENGDVRRGNGDGGDAVRDYSA